MFSKYKMQHNKLAPSRLSQRIAEEAQLLAEEKWIIDTLKKIKSQRNGLQIERLHLESMRAKILASGTNNETNGETAAPTAVANTQVRDNVAPIDNTPQNTEFNIDDIDFSGIDDDEICNMEELNLSVTNSVFNTARYNQQDEEEDEEDMENCVLDIDLLMSGK